MSKEINCNNLVYNFKGPTHPIDFAKFDSRMYIYDQLKNSDITLQQVENQQKDFFKKINEITSGNPEYKNINQLYIIKNVKNLYYSRKKLLSY